MKSALAQRVPAAGARVRASARDLLLRFAYRSVVAALSGVFAIVLAALATAAFALWHVGRDLPDYAALARYEPPIMSRVYAADLLRYGGCALEARAVDDAVAQRARDAVKIEAGMAEEARNKPVPADTFALRQIPEVTGALVAMDPHTGRVLAMSSGLDFARSQFNNVTQAWRQPGSSFKPYVYLAALRAGYTPTSVLLDEPITLTNGRETFSPKTYSGQFYGAVTMPRRPASRRWRNSRRCSASRTRLSRCSRCRSARSKRRRCAICGGSARLRLLPHRGGELKRFAVEAAQLCAQPVQ